MTNSIVESNHFNNAIIFDRRSWFELENPVLIKMEELKIIDNTIEYFSNSFLI